LQLILSNIKITEFLLLCCNSRINLCWRGPSFIRTVTPQIYPMRFVLLQDWLQINRDTIMLLMIIQDMGQRQKVIKLMNKLFAKIYRFLLLR